MKIVKTLFAVLMILAAGLNAEAQTGEEQIIDAVVAVVNNEILLHSDVLLMTQEYMRINKVNPQTLSKEHFIEIYNNTLMTMIESKVEVAQALEDTLVTVTEEDIDIAIDDRLNSIIAQHGSEEAAETAYKTTIKKMREVITNNVRDKMLVDNLRAVRMRDITITRGEIIEFYNTYQDSIPESPDRYDVRHIIMTPKPSDEITATKKAYADSIRQLILNGADFAEMAKQFSEGPSGPKGGDLGWAEIGSFVPEYEEAVKNLPLGEISMPVQTQFGFHIIESLGKEAGRNHTRHILVQLQTTEADAEQLVVQLNELKARAEAGEDFGEMSAEYSIDIQTRETKGLLPNLTYQSVSQNLGENFLKVFRDTKPGEVSKPFRSQFGYHIIKVEKFYPASKITLESNYDQLKSMALRRKQTTFYQSWLSEKKKDVYIDIKPSIMK